MKLITFLDSIGRNIIAEEVKNTNEVLVVQNPVVVQAMPEQTDVGEMRLAIQLFPVFFPEFQKNKSDKIQCTFPKDKIVSMTKGDNEPVEFDDKLITKYKDMFRVSESEPEVVKLFDDED